MKRNTAFDEFSGRLSMYFPANVIIRSIIEHPLSSPVIKCIGIERLMTIVLNSGNNDYYQFVNGPFLFNLFKIALEPRKKLVHRISSE